MTSFVYNIAKRSLLNGNFDLDSNTLKARLLMTNTTADTEKDKLTLSGFTTLDNFDGSGASDVTLANKTTQQDDANNRGELHCDNIAFGALGAGTRQVQGMLIFKFITNDADSVPIAWIDSGGFPFTANGSTVTATINAEGLLQAT